MCSQQSDAKSRRTPGGAPRRRPSVRGAAASVFLWLFGGCYAGIGDFDGLDGADPEVAGDGDGDGGGDSSSEQDVELPESFVPGAGQIRLLNSDEYRSTIRDLLGVEVSAELEYAELGSGFDNGSDGQLGESLFSILYTESQRVAEEYVDTGMSEAFPCFDPAEDLADSCVETVVDQLGRRAFRRPVDAQTRQGLLDFMDAIAPEVDEPREAMTLLVTRMLMSRRFLYRTELGVALSDEPDLALLDPFERASLLSYALIGSMPDEPLLADAEAGALDFERMREHVRRLMATDRGRAQIVRFFEQWLRVRDLHRMARAPEDFPKFTSPEQARSMLDEFGAYIGGVVLDGEGTLHDLLTKSVTFVNRHTAPLYGESSARDDLEPLALDPTIRGGVLTLASVMAVHSSSAEVERDKPIRRGLLVKNQLLCESVGLPSGLDVQSAAEDALDEVPEFDELTTREQMETIMNQDPGCIECHVTFMPYGFLWGNFDALGQYQTHLGDRLIDPAVDQLQLDDTTRPFADIMQMLPELAGSRQVAECFGTNVARYATGRAEDPAVAFMSEVLADALEEGDVPLVTLFEQVLSSPELYVREAR